MSRGIIFKLVKKSNVILDKDFLDNAISEFESKHKDDEDIFFGAGKKNHGHPKYLDSVSDSFDLLDTETGVPYNVAVEYDFGSVLQDVRDYFIENFGMNPYSHRDSTVELTTDVAKEMLVAIDYLLLEKFDKQIEAAMHNEFIDVLGSLSREHESFKYRLLFPNDESPSECEDNRACLEQLKSLVVAFLNCDNRENYKFIVEVWS